MTHGLLSCFENAGSAGLILAPLLAGTAESLRQASRSLGIA